MRKRDAHRSAISTLIRDVIDTGCEYTIYRRDIPVAVVVPIDKIKEMRAELERRSQA